MEDQACDGDQTNVIRKRFSPNSLSPSFTSLFPLASLSHTLLSSHLLSPHFDFQEQAMVSSTLISLLALTPLAFASPTPSTTTQEVEKRGLGYGGIGLGYGGGWGGCKLTLFSGKLSNDRN